ncbi:MAG: hypothetical protein V7K47_17180 [Nostoc sp.]
MQNLEYISKDLAKSHEVAFAIDAASACHQTSELSKIDPPLSYKVEKLKSAKFTLLAL